MKYTAKRSAGAYTDTCYQALRVYTFPGAKLRLDPVAVRQYGSSDSLVLHPKLRDA